MEQQRQVRIDEVVVLDQPAALGVQHGQERVEWRIQAAGQHVQHQHLIGLRRQDEVVDVARLLDAAVDGGRHGDAVRLREGVVRFRLAGLRLVPHRQRQQIVGNPARDRSDEPQGRRVGRDGEAQGRSGQAHAVQFERDGRVPLPAQREHMRQVREDPEGQPVDEIGSPAVDDVADLQRVLAVLRNRAHQHRLGAVAEAIDRHQHLARRIEQGQGGVQEAGDGVGEVRQQAPRLDGADDRLAGLGGEAEAVAVVVQNLAVDQDRQGGQLLRLGPVGVRLDLVDLRQGSDEEPQPVGDSARRDQPQVPLAQFGVGGHRQRDLDRRGVHDLDDVGRHARSGDPHAVGVLELLAVDQGLDRLAPRRSGRKHERQDRLRRLSRGELRTAADDGRDPRDPHAPRTGGRDGHDVHARTPQRSQSCGRLGVRRPVAALLSPGVVFSRIIHGPVAAFARTRDSGLRPRSGERGYDSVSRHSRHHNSLLPDHFTAGGGSFSPASAFFTNSGLCSAAASWSGGMVKLAARHCTSPNALADR